jgi:DNA-binding GntR family transcriptional regulator
MDGPYVGPNLGPLQPNRTPQSEDWSAFPEAPAATGRPSPRIYVNRTPTEASGDSWDAFPEIPGAGAIASDVAKSTGIGAVKGSLGIAGFPGEVSNLLAKGSQAATDFIAEKTGLDPGPRATETMLPTEASLQKHVEDVTGDFYKPQTEYGKYAETTGEFLPSALLGPAGLARKVALQAIVPGVASEAAGQATAGTSLEPYARAAGGIAAGGAGAILSRPATAVEAIRKQLPNLPPGTIDDARNLMQVTQQKGIALTWPEALSQVAGRPVLSDTQRILESAQGSRTRMQDFYARRPQQIDQAALNEFGRVAPGTRTPSQIGPQVGEAAQGAIGNVRTAINNASEPYYQQAESVLLTPAEMTHVRSIPGWTEARDAVRNNPQIGWRVAHLPDNSVGFLNQVKKEFDQAAENAASKFNPAKNREVQSSNEMAASALKQIGEVKSQDYEIALAIQEQARERYLDPLLQGPLGRLAKKDVTTQKAIDALFPSSPLPNSHVEIHDAITRLAARNPGAAAQLVRAHVESVFNQATKSLQGGPNQAGAAGFAKALVGNIQQRTNLEAAITALPGGDRIWQGFDNFLEAAEATGKRQPKGSLTAFNAQELGAMSGGSMIGEAVSTGLSPKKWWSLVSDKYAHWKLGDNLDELARIFTDPRSAPILERISRMPRGSTEAGYLVSRLILQAENAITQPREARRQ